MKIPLVLDAGIAGNTASTKIIDLSKKNRELVAQLESEKSKSVRTTQKVAELESKVIILFICFQARLLLWSVNNIQIILVGYFLEELKHYNFCTL